MMNEQTINTILSMINYLDCNKDWMVTDGCVHASQYKNLNDEMICMSDQGYLDILIAPQSIERILATMEDSIVNTSLISTNHNFLRLAEGNESDNLIQLWHANKYVIDAWIQNPYFFVPVGYIMPKFISTASTLLFLDKIMLDHGVCLVSIDPTANQLELQSEQVEALVERIIKNGGVPVIEYAYDAQFCNASGLEILLNKFITHKIVINYVDNLDRKNENLKDAMLLRECMLSNPDAFLILSNQFDRLIEQSIVDFMSNGYPYCKNIGFGSRSPFAGQAWKIAGLERLIEKWEKDFKGSYSEMLKDEYSGCKAQRVLGENLANFVENAYTRFLNNNLYKSTYTLQNRDQ